MIASNDLFQALLTYYYWADDTAWAVRAWEAIVETLRFGDGIPLETPKDHWSLRMNPKLPPDFDPRARG